MVTLKQLWYSAPAGSKGDKYTLILSEDAII